MIRNHDFQHNGLTLRSTMHIPDGPFGTRRPTVVFIHGFSANRLEVGSSFVHMSRLLESSGIASVRFDLSGHGESDGAFFDITITGEIAEARSVVQTVRTLDFADPSRVGLLGMSMGGVVAAIVAAEEPGIRAVCLWSPAADHAWSTVPHRTRLQQSTLEYFCRHLTPIRVAGHRAAGSSDATVP